MQRRISKYRGQKTRQEMIGRKLLKDIPHKILFRIIKLLPDKAKLCVRAAHIELRLCVDTGNFNSHGFSDPVTG